MNIQKHPEQRDDEIHITNVRNNSDFRSEWKTLRFGTLAYTGDGHVLNDYKPAFIQRDEVQAAHDGETRPDIKAIYARMLAPEYGLLPNPNKF